MNLEVKGKQIRSSHALLKDKKCASEMAQQLKVPASSLVTQV